MHIEGRAPAEKEFQPIGEGPDIYRQMFKHSIVATIIHDLEMRIVEVNDSATRLFGYDHEEFLQKSIYDLHTESELDHSREVLAEMHHTTTLSVKSSFKRKDGSAFFAEATPTKFLLGDKPVIHVFIQDITRQVEREEKVRQYTEELEQFAFIASHDLREPLRTIIGFVELLQRKYADELGDEGAQYLEFIANASIRLRKLIGGLLEYSRLGQRDPLSEVPCNRLVDEVISDLSSLISEKDAVLEVAALPTIIGHEPKLRVLIQNLIANAIHFSKPGLTPNIKITARETEKYWELSVTDNGVGIEPKLQDKIFLIFQRLNQSSEHAGTGIGLSSCRKIARMHGGDIRVDSRPGEGSTFHVSISKRLH